MERKINGKEITPNLNKFLRENIEIEDMIVQSYSTTADSEYSTITSLYPLDNGQAFSLFFKNINNDIFKSYKEIGYKTSYMHGNVKMFWNRENVYKRLSVDNLTFMTGAEEGVEKINTWLSDEEIYKMAVKEYTKYKEPFLGMIVASSSHSPYVMDGLENRNDKITIDVGKMYGEPFKNYLEAANYADYAFGKFIEALKQEELYEESVIIVFGDHFGITMEDKDLEEFMKEEDENYNELSKRHTYLNVLCGLKIPGTENKKITKTVSKLDIKPTLLEISGIEDEFSLGKSFFSQKDYAYVNNGEIITKDYYYLGNEWYNWQTEEKINKEELQKETRKMLEEREKEIIEELNISRSVIINNLLK